MRTLILSDIHGNLPALEAVLATDAARSCTQIVSLGDHVNFGPESRRVQERLEELHAVMLLGNHEERLQHPDDPDFSGYNWRMLHFTAQQMAGMNHDFPTDYLLGSVWCTHGAPGDPYCLLDEESVCPVLDTLPDGVTHLLSGHSHHAWQVKHHGRVSFNPCSVGVPEDGAGGIAPFAVLDMQDDQISLHRGCAAYDLKKVQRAFIETGAAAYAPEMCRAVFHTMQTGEPLGVANFIRHIHRVARSMGLTLADEAAWQAAEPLWHWPEKISAAEYWKKAEEELA